MLPYMCFFFFFFLLLFSSTDPALAFPRCSKRFSGRSSALSFSSVLMLLLFFPFFSHTFFPFSPHHLGRSSALQMLLYMCPRTVVLRYICVLVLLYICVLVPLILLHMCPRTVVLPQAPVEMQPDEMCVLLYICVLVPLILVYICVLVQSCCRMRLWRCLATSPGLILAATRTFSS